MAFAVRGIAGETPDLGHSMLPGSSHQPHEPQDDEDSPSSRKRKEEKLQSEQRLGLFWEHLPPLDPEAVANMMQQIRNHIRGLEERKAFCPPGTKGTNCAGRPHSFGFPERVE
ncbi:hypothetical protein RND71_043781 [Anisodus tanguticus]|uniref:Uncharacterized protein n=1 Tax=Anisodus tanguticus TaxID=243964 RepID=A0AAE1QPD4_9SOLA|nr:hypothetical protein RND71_043781 [Anisodus tanguticus]